MLVYDCNTKIMPLGLVMFKENCFYCHLNCHKLRSCIPPNFSIFYIKYNSRVWAKFILPKTIHKIKRPSNSFYSQHFKNILKDAPIVPLFLTKNQSFTENVNEFLQEQSKDLLNCQYYNISNFF